MMKMRGWTAAIALLLAACAPADAPPEPPADADAAQPAQAPAAPLAPAAPGARAVTPADSAVAAEVARSEGAAVRDTGTTPWRALELPSEPWMQRAGTPEALLRQVRDVVAAQLEEPDASVLPTRMLATAADSASGLLVHPDQADDSVRDIEFRIHMRREGAGWTVAAVERRERCRRGVADGGLCA